MIKPSVKTVSVPASNYTVGRNGSPINRIVIHTQQGTEKGTEAWFANPQAHASSHFGISFAGDITQFVKEVDTAWHAGNAAYNHCSIGIELEGFMEREFFPPPMMDALVYLCQYLCTTYNIPTDRAHVIGHAEVPDPKHPGQFGGLGHHSDPGPGFKWDDFMTRVATNSETTEVS